MEKSYAFQVPASEKKNLIFKAIFKTLDSSNFVGWQMAENLRLLKKYVSRKGISGMNRKKHLGNSVPSCDFLFI